MWMWMYGVDVVDVVWCGMWSSMETKGTSDGKTVFRTSSGSKESVDTPAVGLGFCYLRSPGSARADLYKARDTSIPPLLITVSGRRRLHKERFSFWPQLAFV